MPKKFVDCASCGQVILIPKCYKCTKDDMFVNKSREKGLRVKFCGQTIKVSPKDEKNHCNDDKTCLLYTSPSPRDS